ncbi:MAG: 3'(2'),5'-bisphosphate nucleotidase CysQ [Magnetococcales bacterium]|nr:3'(2'),5'-bisphosphate nucleotidase CysQ [Magnetococcales bacterium]MBF0156240.1 3'(2'),5'-bisphosphate nucleotidase CysQ [Magnetococcales bacterium]
MEAWDRDLALMEESIREAGRVVLSYFRPGEAVGGGARLQDKGRDNPLTQADLEADALLRRTLLSARPDYGWLSEETADDASRQDCRRVWVVDPIDGTKEFIIGLPQFAVSVGLVEDGVTVAGCILNPAQDALYSAVAGGGARLNGQPIRVTSRENLAGASCLASRSETGRGEWDIFRDRLAITTMGSIAYKLALVASGGFDLTFTLTPKNEWDYCAGELLVREAGGRVTQKDGQPLRFNRPHPSIRSVLASNGLLHDPLLAMLRDVPYGPDKR